ncbi:MAG: HlyD family secretion protein [Pseudomonadota bacterium]|jgi:membrane fusion protein (multidrug efflux system)
MSQEDIVAESRRNPIKTLLLWVLPLLVTGVAIWLYGSAGRYAQTDNAYVQRDRIDVSPEVSGNIQEVRFHENDKVTAGALVLVLEDTLQSIAVHAAESRLDTARAEIAGALAAYREKDGEIAMARRAADYAQRDTQRQDELAARKLVPLATVDSSHRTTDLSVGAIGVLELQRDQVLARLGGHANHPIDDYAPVRVAIAELDRARLELARTRVYAPREGIMSHLPTAGSRVDAGRPAFAIVSSDRIWVDANFKETDLEWVRPGQRVQIDIDTYSGHLWKGAVESIASATGAEFALLPAQNASGNWVKVVQRIPVRITVEPGADDPPLRDGMSATVSIDTGAHTRFDRWFRHPH